MLSIYNAGIHARYYQTPSMKSFYTSLDRDSITVEAPADLECARSQFCLRLLRLSAAQLLLRSHRAPGL